MLCLVIYVILLFFSLFFYWRKRRRVDAGVIMLSLYIVYAIYSILLYNDKTFEFQYFRISLFPLLFLYICLIFSFSPVLSFDSSNYSGIQTPTKAYLDFIAWIIILSIVFQGGYVISHLYSGISLILFDEDGGVDLYTKMADNAASGGIGISNIFAIVGNMFYEFGVLLLFYNLTLKKRNKIIIIGLSLAMIIGILSYIAAGQRGGTFKRTLVVIGTFFLLKDFIDNKTQKTVKKIGVIVIAVVAFLFMAISLSRFSYREGGVESSFNRYAGQSVLYFDRYAFDNNGIRYGDRVIPVFKQILTFDNVPRNYLERRAKYPQLKYIPSIAFEEMSGSAKGVTAAKVKGRKFIKNRGYGGRIGTSDQAKNKGVMKMITTSWKSLTNEQILAWNKAALSADAKSILGTKGKISGLNLFQRLNFWVVKLGGAILTTPPTLSGVETPSEATIVCTSAAFTFKLNQAISDNGGIYLIIQASEGQSNGVSRGYGKATQIKAVEEPTDAAIDIKADYEAAKGVLNSGAPKVFFKYFYVDSSTGETSVPMQAMAKWAQANEPDPDEP